VPAKMLDNQQVDASMSSSVIRCGNKAHFHFNHEV